MRNLALVLLLLNIVFLSWQLVLSPQKNTKNTELVSTNTTTPNSYPTLPKPIVNQPPICFQAGAYTDKEKVAEIISSLKNKANVNMEQLDVQTSQTRILRSIWVYLPPLKNKQAAKRTIKNLKQAGFKDYRIIATGKFQNAISLGLYNTKIYADIRVKKLRSKGYKNIKIQKRYKDVKKYVLNFKIPAIQKTLLLNMFEEKFEEPRLNLVACE
jgi:hypothetical protein